MIPGEIIVSTDIKNIDINKGRKAICVNVENTGDRPIQIGSHYHFYEVNSALRFEREMTKGYRLNIAAGTAVRVEPGQSRQLNLVAYAGLRTVYGFQAKVMAKLDDDH